MGTRDALPFADNCRTPTARGPASFFFAALRSPGMICGRSSCAHSVFGNANKNRSDVASTARRYKILRCVIFAKSRTADLAVGFEVPGDIAMKVNDKAPEFTLQDENGKEVALKDLRGKTVVLFFYPRANTPG